MKLDETWYSLHSPFQSYQSIYLPTYIFLASYLSYICIYWLLVHQLVIVVINRVGCRMANLQKVLCLIIGVDA
jgi:hypothetical protein